MMSSEISRLQASKQSVLVSHEVDHTDSESYWGPVRISVGAKGNGSMSVDILFP